ncbi:MAG TPA: homoserine kinase [Candidatus Bathyarchaeia archaeon]
MKALRVEAVAPATSANLGAGFDVFGVALDALFDSVSVEVTEGNNIKISVEGVGAESVPVEPSRNTAGIVAKALLDWSNKKCGFTIKIKKGIRFGSGLGSSAASAAAAALAINEALGLDLSKMELIKYAAQGEMASAGAPHADNVSSAILGFFTVISSYNPLEVIPLPSPKNLEFVIAIPEILKKNTAMARSVLPKEVKLSDLVHNVGHAATFIAGIALNDVELMGKGMADAVVEPARAHLIPGMADVKKSALEAGAAGAAISGAGPSILAMVNAKKKNAEKVAKAMKEAFEKHGIKSQTMRAKPGPGARIVRREEL